MIDILQNEFEQIRKDLIQRHNELNMKASGRWEKSLETEVKLTPYGAIATVMGEPYSYQLVHGRKPGKFPPIKAIMQWIEDKGIKPIYDNISTSSLAFLIARKIAQEGTKYFQQGGTDLVSSVITPQRVQLIIDKVGDFQTTYFINSIVDIFKDLKQAA
ncbi:MAG: hypothetical protein KDD49_03870 [Bacteroidetes bacterium]|nr:hypothetical protein [Bacteroidota bacterium]